MAQMLRQVPIQYELKRNNRFTLEFPTELGFESWQVASADRPKMNQNSVEIPYMNTTFYVAGKYNWEPLTFTIIDTISKSGSQSLMEWVRLHSESVTGRQGYAAGYMKNIVLKALDPTGFPVEKWVLVNAFITTTDFGSNSYDDDGIQTVSFTVQPQYCVLEA